MRRFRFSLDAALHVRERVEEQAQMELAEKQRALSTEEAQYTEICREIQRHLAARAELQRRPLDVTALVNADRYSEALGRALAAQQARMTEAERAVDQARDRLNQRRVDCEVLERLRDQRLEQFRQEGLRIEQQELDEFAILRRGR